MSDERGEVLLPIARAAISGALKVSYRADESASWLAEHGACFVTLTQRGELRGTRRQRTMLQRSHCTLRDGRSQT